MTKVNTLKCISAEFTGIVPDGEGHYHKQYYYSNGYGASVLWGGSSYGANKGLFEVAVLNADGEIVYDTPITSDVCGFLNFGEVADILQRIRNLPVRRE